MNSNRSLDSRQGAPDPRSGMHGGGVMRLAFFSMLATQILLNPGNGQQRNGAEVPEHRLPVTPASEVPPALTTDSNAPDTPEYVRGRRLWEDFEGKMPVGGTVYIRMVDPRKGGEGETWVPMGYDEKTATYTFGGNVQVTNHANSFLSAYPKIILDSMSMEKNADGEVAFVVKGHSDNALAVEGTKRWTEEELQTAVTAILKQAEKTDAEIPYGGVEALVKTAYFKIAKGSSQ